MAIWNNFRDPNLANRSKIDWVTSFRRSKICDSWNQIPPDFLVCKKFHDRGNRRHLMPYLSSNVRAKQMGLRKLLNSYNHCQNCLRLHVSKNSSFKHNRRKMESPSSKDPYAWKLGCRKFLQISIILLCHSYIEQFKKSKKKIVRNLKNTVTKTTKTC